MFGGDEKSRPGYVGPRQAVETCAMVEMMNTCETMFTQVDGDVRWADRCEDVAFNSYPAATMPDMTALRYLTAPNHIVSDRLPKNPDINNGGAMYLMSPHLHRCCQHNHAHGWPYYAEHLWLATPDNGLCAMLYCDSSVTAQAADGQTVTLDQTTRYPFDERIVITVHVESPVAFPLYLRLPAWCDNAQLAINYQDVLLETEGGRYLRIDRTWNDGDRGELVLPAAVSLRYWAAHGQCVSVDRGPLTYSLAIGEEYVRSEAAGAEGSLIAEQEADAHTRWPEWQIFPTTPWNYGLVLDEDDAATSFQIEHRPWPKSDMPWTYEGASDRADHDRTTDRRLETPEEQSGRRHDCSPVRSDAEDETVTLLPMGACRLRLSAFPTIGSGEDAHDWTTTPLVSYQALEMSDGRRIVFSHLHARETPMAAVDGTLPSRSGDLTIPRATFWPYRGTEESVRLEFAKPRQVHGVEVYWFDDTGRGSCRVPASATLRFFQADQWVPTTPSAAVPVELDRMNRLEITPVHTKAIELKIQLRQDYSGGVLEVRIIEK